MSKKVLILTDGKAGHENQSKAFARALGCEAEIVPVQFKSKFHKALSYLCDRLGVRTMRLLKGEATKGEAKNGEETSRSLVKEETSSKSGQGTASPISGQDAASPISAPVAVIGTGSGTFYAAKALAKKLGVKCGVVLYPRSYDIASFDCILAPAFDRPAAAPNVIEIPANLVAADAAFYEKGVASFLGHSGYTKEQVSARPLVAVIVGGPNKCSTMTAAWMKEKLDQIFAGYKASASRASEVERRENAPLFCVTTSRRTPPDVEALIDTYPWDYKLLYSKDRFNPIPGFVKLASKLYVTAESTGMLSEACTSGTAEVVALDNLNPGPHKFRRFVENLRADGYVDGTRKVDLSAQFAAAKKLMGL